MIDLHTHSFCSDGTLSPAELVRLAARKGLSALALTDHDTTAGLDEAAAAAQETGLVLVPGLEIEIDFSPGQFHLLGLGLVRWGAAVEEQLREVLRKRNERNRRILDLMHEADMDVSPEEVAAEAGGDVIGRPHFARVMVAKGYASSIDDAFRRFLLKGRPLFVQRESFSLEEAVGLVRGAGGRAVVAHPLSLYLSWSRIQDRLVEWKQQGVEGLEAYHSGTKVNDARRLEKLAGEVGMFVTAGSDFHGESRPDRKLGRTSGGRKIEDRFLQPFLPG